MNFCAGPPNVIWDITYGCPLRCAHCYSESGRRPSRQLGMDDMLRVADALIALCPAGIALAGGEPLIVPGLCDIAERITAAGIPLALYTSGWTLNAAMIGRITRVFDQISVSVDAATADQHDRLRGRPGSFARAMRALALLDAAGRDDAGTGRGPARLGIDCTVTRSAFTQLPDLCRLIAPRFPRLSFLAFGAVVPAGLASRPGFAEHELLTREQLQALGDGTEARRLRELAPASVTVTTTDNRALQMHPDLIARGVVFPAMQVEPDGAVRAMPMYEGTVGSLLDEPAEELWARSVARWSDPFVTETLRGIQTMSDWAGAARRLDYHFGSAQVRHRIDRRPAFAGLARP
jgi:MoaA/NifB/PqqE/SkfB family radical SAM enzyme